MVAVRRRSIPLLTLIGSLIRRRSLLAWNVYGVDDSGRRTVVIRVGVTAGGVTVEMHGATCAVLRPLGVGRLRGLLRRALVLLEEPAQAVVETHPEAAHRDAVVGTASRVRTVLDPGALRGPLPVGDLIARVSNESGSS